MAKINSTRARGIQVEHYQWGHWVKGTRELLIQHGYAQDGPFPGDPGEKKITLTTTDPAGREVRISRASKYLFTVSRDWNETEKADLKKQQERQEEIYHATRLVDSWPKSAGAFRDEGRKYLGTFMDLMERILGNGASGGYRYDDDTVLRFRLMADQMIELMDTGTVVKDMALREQHTPACIAGTVRAVDSAKQDKSFQQFMAGVAK